MKSTMVHLWSVVATALSIATLVRKAQSQCFTYEETSLSLAPTIFFNFEDTASQPFLDTLKGVEAVIEGAHLNGESLLANSGNALMFDGGHVMIQSISQEALIPASFSITFWAMPLFTPNYEHNQNMQIFSTVQGAGISIVCTVHNQWGFQVGNAEFSSMISGGFCATDHLSFVVASYDASTEEATLYINGEPVASRFVQFPSYPSTQMLLGAGSEANGNSVFDGVLDGFAVYAQVLEENDIQLLYYSGFCPVPEKEHFDAYPQVYFEGDSEQGDSPDCYGNAARLLNPIILFDFQEVDTIIYDEIKNLPGKLEGNFSVIASPVPNGGDAFYFNGIDADVYIEQTSYFNFFTTRSFSIVFWAKPMMQNVDESLVDIPVVSNKKNNLGLSIWCTSTFEWVFFIGAGTVLNAFQGGECSSGTLSLVVAAFDDNTQNAALYVNGDLVSSGMVDGGYSAADTPLYFGSGIEQDGSKGYFEGIIDGVTIFPRSLTPVEVETLAISGNCQGTSAPSVALTPGPTLQPTPTPTPQPTSEIFPTPQPTPLSSTPAPTMHPTPEVFPTPEPTPTPTQSVQTTTAPTPQPTLAPSAQPTWQATPAPTMQPPQPTPTPTPAPSAKPTTKPTHTKRPTPKSGSTTPMPTAEPILGAFENPEAINFLLLNDAYKKGHDIYLNDLSVGSEGEAILNKKWVQHVGIPTSSVTLNFEMLIGGTSPAETCSGSEMIWSYGADNNCMRRRAEFGNEEKCHGVDVGFIIGGSRDGVHIMKDGILERERNGTKLLFNTWMEVRIGLNFNGTHHFLIVAVEDEEYFQEAVLFTHEDLRDYDDLGKMGFFGSTGFIGTKVNLIMGTESSLNKMSGNKQAGNKAAGNDATPAGGNDLPAAGCSPVEFAIRNVLFTNMTDYTSTVDLSASSHSSKMENPNKAEIASLTFTNKMQQALPESTENTLLQFLEGLRDHITGFSMYGQLPFLLVMASFPTGYAGYQVLSSYFSSHQARQTYLPIPV